jgi:hypothetical protein
MRVTLSVEHQFTRKLSLKEYLIDNKKIHIHDNVLNDKIVKKWIEFYENSAKFSLCAVENKSTESSVFLCMPLTLKERIEVFDIDEWLPSYLKVFNESADLSWFNRSYINLMTRGDIAEGHIDAAIDLDSDISYITCLIFLNPYVDSTQDNGFTIEDVYIENKFNRMIVFDGTLFHKSSIPKDDLARLTLYLGFTDRKIKNSYNLEMSLGVKNHWFKKSAQQK